MTCSTRLCTDLERWGGRARVEAIRNDAGDPQTMLDLAVGALVDVLQARASD